MGDAVIEAEQLERAFQIHLRNDIVVGEILDPDDQPLAARAEGFRQTRESFVREAFEIGERRRPYA